MSSASEYPTGPTRAHSIFLDAIEILDVKRRSDFLSAACGQDLLLRQEVDALLLTHSTLGDFLEAPILEDERTCRLLLDDYSLEGSQINSRYTLIRKLGDGGVGQVWLAEQHEPVQRSVAVKLIKPGMDSERILARFRAESQTLALLNHPHIATVLDGGLTPEGRPFFVMELVQGIPLNRYCDEHRLTLEQRLQLFSAICRAVDYAHQQGVIHRDLKPQNLLIANPSGQPVPKIIDFGMARLISGAAAKQSTLITTTGWFSGTPEYMSPEQTRAGEIPTDQRTDIYALGVLLHQLLTGHPPFRQQTSDPAALLEFFRLVREVDAPTPSTKVRGADSLAICQSMGLSEAQLIVRMRPSLDWVILKAIEKSPDRRFQTAAELADDLDRILQGLLPLAGPPHLLQRLRRAFSRRSIPIAAGAAAMVAALIFAAVEIKSRSPLSAAKAAPEGAVAQTLQQAQTQRLAAERATLVEMRAGLENTLERLLTAAPDQQSLAEAALRESIARWDEFANLVGEDRRSEAVRTEALLRLGRIHRALSLPNKSRPLLEQAIDRFERLQENQPFDADLAELHAEALHELARLAFEQGDRDPAEKLFRKAIELQTMVLSRRPKDTPTTATLAIMKRDFSTMLRRDFDVRKAQPYIMDSIELLKQLVLIEPNNERWKIELEISNSVLAHALRMLGEREQALTLITKSLSVNEDLSRSNPEDQRLRRARAVQLQLQGLLQTELSRLPEAQETLIKAAALERELASLFRKEADLAQKYAATLNTLGVIAARSRQTDAAIKWFSEARQVLEKLVQDYPAKPEFQNDLANVLNSETAVLVSAKKMAEADQTASRMWKLRREVAEKYPDVPEYAYATAVSCNIYGQLLLRLNKPEDSSPILQQGIEILQRLQEKFPGVAVHQQSLSNLQFSAAEAAMALDDPNAAETAYQAAIQIRTEIKPPDAQIPPFPVFAIQCFNGIAAVRKKAGNLQGARAALEDARQLIQRIPPAGDRSPAVLTLQQLLELVPMLDPTENTDDIRKQLELLNGTQR
jgi:serine/threonine protein kinase